MIPTYDPKDAEYFNSHCASCGKKDRRLRFIYCGECFHPYLTPKLGLVLHDMKVQISMNWPRRRYTFLEDHKNKWRYKFKSLLPCRFSKIYVCPCCVHDL